jgi:hypothetical protein
MYEPCLEPEAYDADLEEAPEKERLEREELEEFIGFYELEEQ